MPPPSRADNLEEIEMEKNEYKGDFFLQMIWPMLQHDLEIMDNKYSLEWRKLPIVNSKKTTKRVGGGGQKWPILSQHILRTATFNDVKSIYFTKIYWSFPLNLIPTSLILFSVYLAIWKNIHSYQSISLLQSFNFNKFAKVLWIKSKYTWTRFRVIDIVCCD